MRPWPLLMLLFAVMVTAQPPVAPEDAMEGPALTVLLHHPYPDDLDPLGFPFPDGAARGYYLPRYAHFDTDRDGFDFPHVVVDGLLPVEGLPDSSAPFDATLAAYEDAYEARNGTAPPLTIEVRTFVNGDRLMVAGAVVPTGALEGERLHLWLAVAEDPVHYEPPPAASNGITDHRFTVRALLDDGVLPLDDGAPVEFGHAFDLDPDWDPDRLVLAAWVQQGGSHGLRFDANEVVQATSHRVADGGVTRQSEKGVLLQVYSATWCAPCAFGDAAAEDLADRFGLASDVPPAPAGYFLAPEPGWLVAVLVVVGALILATARLPGGKP